jgi:hypothetical protein
MVAEGGGMSVMAEATDRLRGMGLKAVAAHVMCIAGACLLGHAMRSWELSAGLLLLTFGLEWVLEMYGASMHAELLQEIREDGERTRSALADLADAE